MIRMTEETQRDLNTQEKDEPKEEEESEATKLAIFLTLIGKNRKKDISIKAITDKGEVDASRDDEIEVSINPESGLRFVDSSKKLRLKLIKGTVDATIKSGHMPEVAIITANWISGKSPLQRVQVSHLVGSNA
jgi:hypothetical protein